MKIAVAVSMIVFLGGFLAQACIPSVTKSTIWDVRMMGISKIKVTLGGSDHEESSVSLTLMPGAQEPKVYTYKFKTSNGNMSEQKIEATPEEVEVTKIEKQEGTQYLFKFKSGGKFQIVTPGAQSKKQDVEVTMKPSPRGC